MSPIAASRSILTACICLAVLACAPLQAKETVLGSVDLDDSQRFPAVPVHLNGQGPFLFLVSTTSSETLINEALATELGLKAGGRALVGDPDDPISMEGDRVRVQQFGLGDVEIPDVQAVSLDLARMFGGSDDIAGVLAYPTLSEYLWTLDLADGRLTLGRGELPPPDGKKILPYTLDGEAIPTLSVRLAGRETSMQLSTLLFGSIGLHTDLMDVLPLAPGSGMIGMTQQGDEAFVLLGAVLDGQLALGGSILERPKLMFSDGSRHPSIGAGALREFAMTFDPKHRRIRFERKESRTIARLHQQAAQVAALPGPGALREAFNRDAKQVRLLFVLSPTCEGCVTGARVMQEMLAKIPSDRVSVHVVWTPVVPGDDLEAAKEARGLISDPRAVHYWDPEQHLGLAYGTAVELPRGRELAWDIYFAFEPGVKWENRVPAPKEWVHQLGMDDRRLADGARLQASVEGLLGRMAVASSGRGARP